ncbi:hypothetical protein MMC18_004628 [Xylographa bjoerkii]|nr:hypothetical protein [Xylographa bjoerkii]
MRSFLAAAGLLSLPTLLQAQHDLDARDSDSCSNTLVTRDAFAAPELEASYSAFDIAVRDAVAEAEPDLEAYHHYLMARHAYPSAEAFDETVALGSYLSRRANTKAEADALTATYKAAEGVYKKCPWNAKADAATRLETAKALLDAAQKVASARRSAYKIDVIIDPKGKDNPKNLGHAAEILKWENKLGCWRTQVSAAKAALKTKKAT